MTPFLKVVAEDIIRKIGTDLSRTVIVFPNRRASLFFNDYLAGDSPIWAPRYQTISELFTSLSPLTIADSIETVCRIYNIYKELSHTEETLDHFYGWGERLLADFDDVDKNLANTKSLFANISDYHHLTNVLDSPLTEQQREALRRFLVDFRDETATGIRAEFYSLWDHIGDIYRNLNNTLEAEGLAYEGALYRRVIEGLKDGTLLLSNDYEHYIFVGFNVLDAVEHELFSYLKREGRALFYWDYDTAYVGNAPLHEAGRFLRQNLQDFPNELPEDIYNNLYSEKSIEYVAAPTDNAQVFAAADWLAERLQEGGDPRRTALVLCNEELVEPVLYALPDEAKHVNITKGFPLAHTPAAILLDKCLREQNGKDSKRHENAEILAFIAEKMQEAAIDIARKEPEEAERSLYSLLAIESYYQTTTILERFLGLTERGILNIEPTTLSRLLRQVARSGSIPFHGDPAQGLQVLGMLETRNLDFENLLVLSANDDLIPRRSNDNSFIPYPLRKAYGLTDAEKRTAVYAYYFYRLLQRAKKIRLCYNCTSTSKRTAEMSRFMRQLLVEERIAKHITQTQLTVRQTQTETLPLKAQKPQNLLSILNEESTDEQGKKHVRPLSPTSINNFLDCPLRFYYQRVARITAPQADGEDIENTDFGSIFHRAAELLYEKLEDENGNIRSEDLKNLLESPQRWKLVSDIICKAFDDNKKSYNEVAAVTIDEYLRNLIRFDSRQNGIRIIALEKEFSLYTSDELHFKVGGTIDRLDSVIDPASGQRIVRVLDYKTGRTPEKCRNMDAIFEPNDDRPKYFFQTFLYTLAVKKQLKTLEPSAAGVTAVLFYPLAARDDNYDPRVSFEGKPLEVFSDEMGSSFETQLKKTISDILNPEETFDARRSDKSCRWCDYKLLCGIRENKL